MAENKENSSLLNITDSTNNNQISMTESVVMSEGIVHSTPVSNNRVENNEIMKMMQMLFSEQKSEIRGIQNNFNIKCEELKNEIQRQNGSIDKVDKLNKDDKVSSGENYDNRIKNMEMCIRDRSRSKQHTVQIKIT